ncbi:hypothetical protein QY702_12060 [Xanthomonas campestris pv. plantaginis]|uniref:hypothetical protein n=1 Tax=Xanthomonas campestris TaxID=339 RepID=UPI002B232693|nr:hypothetical protein [Xanthomonas campestris]MEA9607169.1 hypothetical protein [Xanthomonas campestris pv. plantaginis]
MRQSLVYVAVMLVAITGCASRPVQIAEQTQREASVDQRMLAAQPPAEGAAAVTTYVLAPTQRFRMPRALRSDTPQLAPDTARTSLPPTTVCAHVILDASGTVQRVDPMSDRDACAAGLLPANADLLQAVRATVQQWQFVPAALCAFAPGVAQPADMDDCSGAERQEPVPVTLSFAFTFEIRQGKVSVQTGKVGR